MKAQFFTFVIVFITLTAFGQSQSKAQIGPTDTLLVKEFNNIPGNPTILSYSYSNGSGYFFGTNFIDIDQDPQTPYENGVQAFAQGFPVDTSQSYYVLDILVRVGIKSKDPSSTGTPLILSLQYLDDSSTYTVNTSSGSISYTVHAPGTALGSASIPYDDMITGVGINYSVAHLSSPVLVEKNFCVVVDLMDFYLNNDRIGLWVSPPNGGSNIYGLEYTLWLYPNPMLWLQVNHIFSNVNRAIAIFPVVDDGTYGIENDKFLNGLKLGQSYPNPAKERVNVEFELKEASRVELEFTDAQGKLVKKMNLGNLGQGKHQKQINTSQWKPGVYFYTLHAGNKNITKRLVISN